MNVLYLTEAEVRSLITMDVALEAVEAAFRKISLDEAVNIPRQRCQTDHVMLHVLPAAAKTLGARRTMLMRAYLYEYALLAASASVFALLAATAAAWYVVTQIMQMPFAFLPGTALSTVLIALLVTAGTGLAGTWSVLGQKAAPVLREL